MREIAFDTETTGLEPKQGHRIIELGCIEIINKVRTGKYFHAYINPERDVPQRVVNIHGITGEFLADKPLFRKIAKDFLAFLGDSPLVIHNASFDMKFINFELDRASLPLISEKRAIDTLIMSRTKFPGAKASLDAMCDRFGISLLRREKHGALLDAELLADVYICLTGGSQSNMFEEVVANNKVLHNFIPNADKQAFLEPRNFNASPEELEKHKEFLAKKIKTAMWDECAS